MSGVLLKTEWIKLKRTGITTAMLSLGLLAAAFSIINFKIRGSYFLSMSLPPMEVLIGQTYPVIAFLNLFAAIIGGCIIYHIEYQNNAVKKIMTLPVNASHLYVVKLGVMLILFLFISIIELAALIYIGNNFLARNTFSIMLLLKFSVFVYLLSVPVIAAMMLISALCKNLWIALGVGVTGLISGMSVATAANKIFL